MMKFKTFFKKLSDSEFESWTNKCMAVLWGIEYSEQSNSANFGHYITLNPFGYDTVELYCDGSIECNNYNFNIPIVKLVKYIEDADIEWHENIE